MRTIIYGAQEQAGAAMRYSLCAITALTMCLQTGCKDGMGPTPRSSGQPYEVVVTGTNEAEGSVMAEILRAMTAEGLPQNEPAFDVSATNGDIGQLTKYARSIVVADIDGNKYADTRVRYEKNVYAKPQMVVYVCSPSVERMRTDSVRIQKAVGSLLSRFELNTEMSNLQKAHNNAAELAADSIFGHGIWITRDIQAMKNGKDFLWLSDNSATAMRNICVYSYPGTTLNADLAVRMRDSVMSANIPGETPQMYMTTAVDPTPKIIMLREKGRTVMETRGLWEMKGDAMGGPFVSHSIVDSLRGRIIVAEAFVFAPGKKKRNLIRQLEAALYTLK